ncbi:MAG: sulfur carrier protein ThiS [Evtepia sp.]|uniref:sulfur carrier protein ThiS n=1 Tax=Evtepia sp. TaxID=2773933 RepID=UPI0029868FCE|nr:sulfur carrier protein ThiS [Evtepia sp.]MDD7288606.1 sulfur carrier protein ThiS [Clostridiales bacterium]MDY3993970.1 sulfur carrier protein ThiS [Evtepia sp.]MDY4429963.1 sulfur carrier protein ThiS [Evtepia sp.]
MTITVAGNKKEYPEGLTVGQLIQAENVETPLYVTVSLNDEFLDSAVRDETVLKDGDEVEFLYFMGGGC